MGYISGCYCDMLHGITSLFGVNYRYIAANIRANEGIIAAAKNHNSSCRGVILSLLLVIAYLLYLVLVILLYGLVPLV